MPSLSSPKAVIRCRDLAASRAFYTDVLGLPVVEEWDQAEGRGCILALADERGGGRGGGGFLELAALPAGSASRDATYLGPVVSDKIALQIGTASVDDWAGRLAERWPFEGPVDRPWGQRYLWVRDPDGVRIALVEVIA